MSAPNYPIFSQYTVEELAKRLPYKEVYISQFKAGYKKPNLRFKSVTAGVLNQSIEQLWGGE